MPESDLLPPADCTCETHHLEKEEDLDYTRVFREGTTNLTSAHTFDPDSLYLLFSHNFFGSSFPRGSNPAFYAHYVPLPNLQLDVIAALRQSPLELELGLKYQLLNEYEGDLFSLAPRIAYNNRGHILGFELSASRFVIEDLWQLGWDYRFLSNAREDGFDRMIHAFGFNTIVRVWKHWHLFADLSLPLDGDLLQRRGLIWHAGIKKRIPHTPHILTLYAGNTQEGTLTGRTISPGANLADVFRVGFVFSIEIPALTTLPSRLF
ncbi:MAG: hypothetical protein IGS03_12065 [Candidatus Sericytochromatia bacterium]|nr:hypothetical protein [Candidatus Sericytochromatia bacterium]